MKRALPNWDVKIVGKSESLHRTKIRNDESRRGLTKGKALGNQILFAHFTPVISNRE